MITLHIKRNRPSAKWSAQLNNLPIISDAVMSIKVNATSRCSYGKDKL